MDSEKWVENELAAWRGGFAIRRPTNAQSLFKYVDLNTKTSWDHFSETIEGGVLRGSTSNSLNDPFEMKPNVFDDIDQEYVDKNIRSSNLSQRIANSRDGTPLPNPPKLEEVKEAATKYLDQIQRYYRVISFCGRADSPLLWSHYANSYKGACVHFFGRAFRRQVTGLGYVTYSQYRPIYPLSLAFRLSQNRDSSDNIELLKQESAKLHFFTKAIEWSYEDEIRIAYNSNSQKQIVFDRYGLASVILGPRMPAEEKERVREIIRKSKRPEMKVREAKVSSTSFSVEIVG